MEQPSIAEEDVSSVRGVELRTDERAKSKGAAEHTIKLSDAQNILGLGKRSSSSSAEPVTSLRIGQKAGKGEQSSGLYL